jgi:dGTP triphosphohydrolase
LADVLVASRKRLAAHDAAPREAARPLIGPSREGGKLTTSLLVLLERRVLARPELRRADARAERIVEGLFLAYGCDPLLLDDAVLLRYRDLTGRPFLRDLPAARVGEELARHYHGEPRLARLLADHIAGMTDRHAEQSWRALTPSGGYL